ncbi:HNH/ENDO VII family nuclease [Pseudogracilibacillus sp. SO30301A]|uniref:HNH/ENDO VII family nuclease n=1 Tax=Pseudogracilibacillus sp. SO30301A TaxID=3098291 RepID=UPI00300E357A
MEVLWDLYNSKVKPFENTDDAYNDLASTVKKKYTGFFEGLVEKSNAFDQTLDDISRGFIDGVIGMVTGIVTIAGDVGIVALSAIIPDPIEPEWIKTKADETFEGYKETAIQLIQNPMSMLELTAQSVSDTVEAEGIAYVTGGAFTALIPASFGVKVVKGGAGIKGPGKAKVDKSPYSKEFFQRKIDAASAGLGNVKVPVFYKEKLSTGSSDITSSGIEMKSLSEVQPQMFKGKGDGVGSNSTGIIASSFTGLKSTKVSSEKVDLDWLPDRYNAVEVKGTVKVSGKDVDVSRRVYQIDIDKNYVPKDPSSNGLTNQQLMAKGKAPYVVKDGVESKVELHHLTQKEPGGMVEIAEVTHDAYSNTLHGLIDDGQSFRNNPELSKQYDNFRNNYWKMRFQE